MLGLTKREITRRFDEIVEFAELQDFIDAPVKTYSSGMYMRLGFAVAIHVDPEVLLVDEVLAVGDEGFTHKCLDKFAEFKRRGKTILLVTHSLGLVERFCDEALWMDAGRTKLQGDPKRVVGAYITDVEKSEEQHLAAGDAKAQVAATVVSPTNPAAAVLPDTPSKPGRAADMFRATEGRWGSREIEITDVELLGAKGVPGTSFTAASPDGRHPVRAPARWTTSSSASASSTPKGSAATAPTPASSSYSAVKIHGDAEAPASRSSASIWSRAPTSWTSRSTSSTAIRTTTTGCSTRSASSRAPRTSASTVPRTSGPSRDRSRSPTEPMTTPAEARDFVRAAPRRWSPVVFTNGVFDILHPGHIRYLQQARALGDLLIVGLNCDASVRRNKGPQRPINDEAERAEILAALECVDAVVIFDEDTPAEIIKAVQPDILVKGADWAEDAIVGRDTVEARGGRVVRVPLEQGYSTPKLRKIRALPRTPSIRAKSQTQKALWSLRFGHAQRWAAPRTINGSDKHGPSQWPPTPRHR